jgi:hypothetical protein
MLRVPAFVLLIIFSVCLAAEVELLAQEFDHFERKIRPLLVKHCYACHSSEAKTVHGGLRVDSAASFLQGGDSGSVIDKDHLAESLLLTAIRYDDDIQMPPKGKLTVDEIAEFSRWVENGAPMPPSTDVPERVGGQIDFSVGRSFWSFQPARLQPDPHIQRTDWPQTRLDRKTCPLWDSSA